MRRFFFCLLVLGILTAPTSIADASTMVATLNGAHVTLSLSPDPPQVGSVHAVVTVDGAAPDVLDRIEVTFGSEMPSMHMTGSSSHLRRDATNRWSFDTVFAMATTWHVVLHFSGGLTGDVPFDFAVAGAPSTDSMASMSSGNADVWRIAAFALIAIVIIGAVVLYRDRRPATIAAIVVVALIVLGLAVAQARFGSPSMDMSSMQSASGNAPAPVTLYTISGSRSGSTISVPANVVPYLTQNIVARAPGLLTDLSVYTGDHLVSGQVVARLQEPELQADAQSAAAQAQAAEIEAMHHAPNGVVIAENDAVAAQADVAAKARAAASWDSEIRREAALLDQGAVSRREYEDELAQAAAAKAADNAAQVAYDSAKTRIGDANASVEMAQAQARGAAAAAESRAVMAGYGNVIVPDNSIVTKRLIDPGVYVQSGTPILQVAVVDRLRVQAQVSQGDLANVRVGTPVDVVFDNGRRASGYITSVSPVVDSQTHTAIAEAVIRNPGGDYQPGAFAHAILHVGSALHGGVSIPSAAVVGGATTAVWINDSGTARRVAVSVLSDDGSMATVTGALKSGTRVVVTGASTLEEGQAIREVSP